MSRCLSVGLAFAVGLGVGCRPYAPEQPVEETPQACCTVADPTLQKFEGCRIARGECRMRKGERFWMRGRVTCGPVEAERCAGGRCCSYLPIYGTPAEPTATTGQGPAAEVSTTGP